MGKRLRRLLWTGGTILVVVAAPWAVVPELLPGILEWYRPEIVYRGDRHRKVIYVTIDDSPTSGTEKILAVLAKHRVPATFFVISGRIRSGADLRSIVEAGHSLGNHLRTTKACSRLGWDEFKADFDEADHALRRVSAVRFFRPPSGFCTVQQAQFARSRGCTPLLGTVYPLDALIQNKAALELLVRWLKIRGGILIMHDGDARAATTAAVLDEMIPELRRKGFAFASLQELNPGQPSR